MLLNKERRKLKMRKRREKISCISLVLLLLFGIATVYIAPVSANETKISVDPPSVIDPTLTPPKNFTIDVILVNVTDLYGWEYKLKWDPTILNLTSHVTHVPAGWDEPGAGMVIKNIVGPDYHWYAFSALAPTPAFNGSISLCTYTFQVTGIGRCALDLYEVMLIDSKAEDIPHSVEDGYFDNRPPPLPALIFVDPPRIVNLTLVPCENFAINVSIIDATYLYSFEFKLSFDPDLLNATDAVLGDIFPPVAPTIEINNTAGYVWFSASLEPPEPEVSGNGTLAVITFHVEGLGACELALYDTVLADSDKRQLPHSTSDGYFNNVLLAKLAVEPPEIFDPSLMPPATFEINITLADVEDLYGYEFNLSFNPDILACVNINIHDVLGETNYTPDFITNNYKGFVWVNVTYYPPAEPITTYPPVTLVTIRFRVKALGVTPLDLHDTSLTDSLGQPIPHEAFDGVFLVVRDVAVTDVVPSKTQVYEGSTVCINVTVRNEGNLTETFNVSAYYDDDLIGTHTVIDLPPGESETLIFDWNTTGVQPCFNYTIRAEADTVPYETDTADNVGIDGKVKIKMLGDINGDGTIDIRDITIVALAFGSKPGDPNWNSDADVHEDGVINIKDIVTVAINAGKTC